MLYSKNKKRGFTLVELIVVLVILAILAALLIPALTGYIDKAKKDSLSRNETALLFDGRAFFIFLQQKYTSDTLYR